MDVVIMEGFERVGKTQLLKEISSTGSSEVLTRQYDPRRIVTLTPNYYSLPGVEVPVDQRWIIGKSILDFMNSDTIACSNLFDLMLVDRSLVTSIVYAQYFNQRNQFSQPEAPYLVKSYFESLSNLSVSNVLVRHHSEDSARQLYSRSQTRSNNDSTEKYEQFDGFKDYWSSYLSVTKKFEEVLKIVSPDYKTYESIYREDYVSR